MGLVFKQIVVFQAKCEGWKTDHKVLLHQQHDKFDHGKTSARLQLRCAQEVSGLHQQPVPPVACGIVQQDSHALQLPGISYSNQLHIRLA